MIRRSALCSVALASIAAPAALAADDARSALDDAIEVVARGYEASAVTAVPKVTVISRDDIDRRQARSVAELLSEVPGALVASDGPHGQYSRLYMRGAASNQTLVLVDGVPQNDATGGGLFDFNDLGTATVDRVDVLRGSYGVLYGSEAIGGVVSVTTRRGRGPWRGFARLEGGSFASRNESAGFGGGDDDFDLWVTAANDSTNGDQRRTGFDATEASVRTGFRLAPNLRADWTLRSNSSRAASPYDFPLFGATVLPEDGNIERDRKTFSTGVTLTHEACGYLTTRLSASWLRVQSTFLNGSDGPERLDPDGTPGNGDEITVVRDELDSRNVARDFRMRLAPTIEVWKALGWKSRRDGGVELDVTFGGEFLDQESTSDSTSPNFGAPGSSTTSIGRGINTMSGFAQAEARFPDLGPVHDAVVAVGARRDRHEVFGSESSPFVGARAEFAPTATTLRGSWGEGFRAPKPSELDDPFVGNGALGAETSQSYDAGVSQDLLDGRLELGVTAFRLDVDGLIAYDGTATSPARPFGQLVNFQNTRTTGTEWEARADLGAGFNVRGAYTRQNPRDLDTGRPLPNRSREFAGGGVSWERGAFLTSLDALWSTKLPDQGGEYTAPDGDARRAPGLRALVNLTARWRASENVTLFGRIENLLDDDWVSTPTSPAGTGRGVSAGVQIDF
ncbi:MAG: TonB-dependent receptor [Planctomycetes bacterium]|nr:TonB-dependent receptor [Planctomycetota bacterium]